ncbi:metal-dependent hydrolase [Ideonella alba]|uniref:Metal-dependent hydrolase n=1 Tax=Ideonella alba TaxID=2824118 RepID=A0A941BDY0_9BURK|nr:metal-dependent hydrolase [Ideonella alba]
MPSILSHVAVPIAGRVALGKSAVLPSLFALGLLASCIPDADVALLRLGVPYDSEFGHRGASHSLAFAVLLAAAMAFTWARVTKLSAGGPFLYLLVCAASHPLLDTCTNAGHGAALLWPLSGERYFAPFRPIEASPLSLRRFFGEPGLRVLVSELLWVWLPSLLLGALYAKRRRRPNAA